MDYELFFNTPSLKGKLKPMLCKSCIDDGYDCLGVCDTCLKNKAWNIEYLQTHTFVYDTEFGQYHQGNHNAIKGLTLRLPNEHPYLYYGIEVEVEFDRDYVSIYGGDDDCYDEDDDDECDNYSIQRILDKFSEITDGLFVYEHDSSLDNGVELISRPCSYAFWSSDETVKKLEEGFKYLRNNGALIDQPITNGLHIHISKKFFDRGTTSDEERVACYTNFDWVFQKFQSEIEKLGGRKYTSYCASKIDKIKNDIKGSWAVRCYGAKLKTTCELEKADGGSIPHDDHSSAVNSDNRTVEVRVFKSTTDYKQILAYIEMIRNITHAVRDTDLKLSLNEILHTKDNKFLDAHIQQVKMACGRSRNKLNLDIVNDNKIKSQL